MRKKELYKKALSSWGKEAQIILLIEEMAELTQTVIHLMRNNKEVSYIELASEVADVYIMLEQLREIYPISDLLYYQKKKKYRKLKKYLDKYGE